MGTQNTVSLRRFCENSKQMLNFQPKDKHWVHKRDGSFAQPLRMFKLMDEKIFTISR